MSEHGPDLKVALRGWNAWTIVMSDDTPIFDRLRLRWWARDRLFAEVREAGRMPSLELIAMVEKVSL
ncbi:hypothetical protein PBI_DEWDROP_41 [Microbacterium phage Dewdrop]|nr:hypothetical protein PBI_LEAF_41 [Microbacterium phage Leaf]QGZ17410.1 hypothetical protein PBI_DEWDROP_41 [Microbacterium phage Dewdrop]